MRKDNTMGKIIAILIILLAEGLLMLSMATVASAGQPKYLGPPVKWQGTTPYKAPTATVWSGIRPLGAVR